MNVRHVVYVDEYWYDATYCRWKSLKKNVLTSIIHILNRIPHDRNMYCMYIYLYNELFGI